MGKPVRRFFCMQKYVVKRDAPKGVGKHTPDHCGNRWRLLWRPSTKDRNGSRKINS